MMMKNIFLVTLFFIGAAGPSWAKAALRSEKTTVVFFGDQGADNFEKKVKPLFIEQARTCKSCEIIDMSPYDASGKFDLKLLAEKIESLPGETSFVFFGFNMKVNDQNKGIVEVLNKKAEAGLVVVGTAGIPGTTEASGPLSRTILGQVHSALIIGELGEKDRLIPTGFYGPEMLTAVRPPKDFMGQGVAPLIFAAELAENWPKRTAVAWVEFLKNKKMKTRKIWLEMGDVF